MPVIVSGSEVIVGFDPRRLERLAQRVKAAGAGRGPRLGLRVKTARGGGAEVGGVRPGSPGERAGLRPGDVVIALAGRPVRSSDDLEAIAAQLPADRGVDIDVVRDGQRMRTVMMPG